MPDLERTYENGVAATDKDKVDELSQFFKSVNIYEPAGTLHDVLHPKARGIIKLLDSIEISEIINIKTTAALNPEKSHDLDKIHPDGSKNFRLRSYSKLD